MCSTLLQFSFHTLTTLFAVCMTKLRFGIKKKKKNETKQQCDGEAKTNEVVELTVAEQQDVKGTLVHRETVEKKTLQ